MSQNFLKMCFCNSQLLD